MVNVMVVLAQTTYTSQRSATPAQTAFGIFMLVALIYCAYKTVSNGHTIMFVLGFCFPLLWIIGAFMGKKY